MYPNIYLDPWPRHVHLQLIQTLLNLIQMLHICIRFRCCTFAFDSDCLHSYWFCTFVHAFHSNAAHLHLIQMLCIRICIWFVLRIVHKPPGTRSIDGLLWLFIGQMSVVTVFKTQVLCGVDPVSSPQHRSELFTFHPRPPPPPLHANLFIPTPAWRLWEAFDHVAITVCFTGYHSGVLQSLWAEYSFSVIQSQLYILVYAASESRQFSVN